MLKSYHILTITHRHTALKQIADYVITAEGDALATALNTLKEKSKIEELSYLATCNRVFYCIYTNQTVSNNFIYQFFKNINPKLKKEDMANVQRYSAENAIRHLMQVSSSIDSMVVGEREILRQIKESYEYSRSIGITGDNIRMAMERSIVTAKEIYTNTSIGDKSVSVVALAMEAMQKSGLSANPRILMIGAGQTNTLVSKFLNKYNYTNVSIFNRNEERATSLAQQIEGAVGYSLVDLENWQKGFDCLIVCTGATQAIIDTTLYQKLLNNENGRKVVIDLSIPHNVAEDVVEQFDIHYIEIEGLKSLVEENRLFREKSIVEASNIIDEHLNNFRHLYLQRCLTRAMQSVPTEIKAIKSHTTKVVFKKEFESLEPQTQALLVEMLNYMEKQCISIPMKAAKEIVM